MLNVFAALESLLVLTGMKLKQALSDLCDLASTQDEHTFVTADGGLLSLWRIHGTLRLVGAAEFEPLCEQLHVALATPMKHAAYGIDIVFTRDPDRTRPDLERQLAPLRANAQALGLALDDLLAARIDTLSEHCVFEETYLGLRTRPLLLTRPQRKAADKLRTAAYRERVAARATTAEAQNPDLVYADLVPGHRHLVQALDRKLRAAQLVVEPLEVHAALAAIRAALDAARSDPEWRAALPGDPLPLMAAPRRRADLSDLFWPTIGQQLFFDDAEDHPDDSAAVCLGDRLFSSVYIEKSPEYLQRFDDLFIALGADLPFRLAFSLDGDGLAGLPLKSMLAAMLVWTDPLLGHNQAIVKAIDATREQDGFDGLRALVQKGATACKLRISATTWAPRDNLAALRDRRARLQRALEIWGTMQVRLERGDPAEGLISTLPGVYDRSLGVAAAGPLADIVRLLPVTRPASPWRWGALLLRSEDGKLWPFQPGIGQLPYATELYLGPQGSAKSQTMHQANLAFLLSGGGSKLPYLGGIDFGGSAAGLVTLIQEALRPALRYQVLYRRLQNRPQDAINFLDTQLGCREPLPHERSFAANFLTLLGTPINAREAEEGVTEIALAVLQEVYATLRDDAHGHPKRYDPHADEPIRQALARYPLQASRPAWWQVVDHLFDHGDVVNAVRAQRLAVPTLEDCIYSLSNSNAIRTDWGRKLTRGGELLLEALSRQWRDAARQFPYLARPTALDSGNARVVVLDLEEVASRGGAASERETAVAFMLARHVTANVHFLHLDHLPAIPERYRPYQAERIREIMESPKGWFCDEVHRAHLGGQATLTQTEHDNIEARKRNVRYALATQSLDHLSPFLVENSSVRVICRAEPAALDGITAAFKLTPTEQAVIRTRLHGPTPAGAPLFIQCETQDGTVSEQVVLTTPAEELWAFSTVAEDRALRERVTESLSPIEARQALLLRFPTGSAKLEVERRRQRLAERGLFTREREEGILDELARETLELWWKKLAAR